MSTTGLFLLLVASLVGGVASIEEKIRCDTECKTTCKILEDRCNLPKVHSLINSNTKEGGTYKEECGRIDKFCHKYCNKQCKDHLEAYKECGNVYKNRRYSCFEPTVPKDPDCKEKYILCLKNIDEKARNPLFKEASNMEHLRFVLAAGHDSAHHDD